MNQFTNEYYHLIGKSFICYGVQNTNFIYFRFIPRVSDLDFVYRLSQEKANFEMNQSQNAIVRTPEQKIEKTFEGTLAELAVVQFLYNVCNIEPKLIQWYNIERSSFKYNHQEYDIRLNNKIDIGVRSSYYKESNDISGVFFTKQMDYMLYQNSVKKQDKKDDFQMRVLYLNKHNIKYTPKTVMEIISDLLFGRIEIYIVGGIKCSEILSRGTYKKMGQRNTVYCTLNLKEGPNLQEFSKEIHSYL